MNFDEEYKRLKQEIAFKANKEVIQLIEALELVLEGQSIAREIKELKGEI